MRLLLVLLAMMTWTVESKNSVSLSDDSLVPYDIEVSYANTGRKGDVTDHDTATLVLGHLEGIPINSIEVYVKSNKAGGAGTFTVTADGQTIATKSGTFYDWFGTYDNENYHALSLLSSLQNDVDELKISLVGTTNSLHIEKYVITYSARPVYTVTLMKGSSVYTTLAEETGGAGVVLPNMPDTAQWQFLGWSGTDFWQTPDHIYSLYPAGERFYMTADRTLWATYRLNYVPEQVYAAELESGEYIYMNTIQEVAFAGVPENGMLEIVPVNPENASQWYNVTFNEALDSAMIQNVQTGAYVGYEQDKLKAKQSVWSVYHEDEKTVFYMTYNNKKYVLFPNIMAEQENYSGLYKTENIASAPTALMAQVELPCCEEITCHPGETQGIEEVMSEGMNELMHEWRIPLGNYELIIKDGKKYIKLK